MAKGSDIPDGILPMMATSGKGSFDDPDWAFEVKWDGTRAVAISRSDGFILHNRRLAPLIPRFPELAALATLPKGAALDGEVVIFVGGKPALDLNLKRQLTEGRLKSEWLAKQYPATFVAWDLLYEKGRSLMEKPLHERRARLEEFTGKHSNRYLLLTDQIVGDGSSYFDAVYKMDLEGLIAKRLDSPYQPGKRSRNWLKIKAWKTRRFNVIGYTENVKQRMVSGVLLGEKREDGSWFYRGSVGSGFPEQERYALLEALSQAPPLDSAPRDGPRNASWRAIDLHCRIMFLEETKSGHLRSPVFKGWVR